MMMMRLALTIAVTACSVYGYTWTSAKFGGGGYVTGIEFSPTVKGLAYARTDVGGAYRRDPWSTTWVPLQDSFGSEDWEMMGVLSIALDPNNDQIVYLLTGMYLADWARKGVLFKSTNRGWSFTRVELPFQVGGNKEGRGTGERLQVDPNLSSTLWLGTNNDGLWKSTDSGATWNRVWDFWLKSTTFVTIDGSTGWKGSASQRIFVGVPVTDGTATVYQSTDGGKKWSQVPNQPTGLMAYQGKLDGRGNLYVTYGNVLGPNDVTKGAVYKYRIKDWAWDNITPPQNVMCGFGGVTVSRANPDIVVISTLDRWATGDDLYRSMNGGKTWTALNQNSQHDVSNAQYLEVDGGASKQMGHWITDVEMDPFADDHIMYNSGFGLWETTTGLNNPIKWWFSVDGLEETVVLMLKSPSSGPAHLMVGIGDYNGIVYKDNIWDNSKFFHIAANGVSVDFAHYWGSFMARTSTDSKKGYLSWNGGDNWWPMSSNPVPQGQKDPGVIAVSADGQALVWVPPGQSAYYSHDNGVSWTKAWGYSTDKYFPPIADRNDVNYFYAYDYVNGQILESSDKGKSWHQLFNNVDKPPSWATANQLISIPLQRRELWLGTTNGLWRVWGPSCSEPVKIPNVQSAYGVSYGASRDGKGYPAIYIIGKINNKVGVYQSLDVGQTWTRINDDQHQYNSVYNIAADPRKFGVVYLGTPGRGVIQGTP